MQTPTFSTTTHAILIVTGIVCLIAAVFFAALFLREKSALEAPPSHALYRNASAPVEERIDDLLSYMTLEEKVAQMALVEKNSVRALDDISRYGIGALLSGAGGKPEENTIEGWTNMISAFTASSREGRLGIPILYGVDAIHGHANVPGATVFPHFIGLGAARDAVLVADVARATAEEMRATHANWNFAPTLDMPRDIRWGRVYETFSDDPARVAQLGSAYVKGLQDTDERAGSIFVLSTLKHYVGNGATLWGSSSYNDFVIDRGVTIANDAALRSEHLPPFEAAMRAGAKSVMVGLNSWDDEKLSGHRYLITTVLKEELGFDGFVVSDWYGVYEIPGDDYTALVKAIDAGVDMVMLPFDYTSFINDMVRAVEQKDISMDRIDDAVRRILRVKFALGLFDAKETVSAEVVGSAEHRALARKAVARSLVLLRNDNVLPIQDSVHHIRVAGSAAHNVGRQTGGWTVEWQGIDGNWLPGATSILEGMQRRAGVGVEVEYDRDADFKDTTSIADLGIAVVGEEPYAEGWGDREYPVLSTEDRETIEKLQAVSEKVVVILVSGRPLLLEDDISSWDALVAAWLPGSEGAGVADVLFGDVHFSGTLPLPWPQHKGQLPFSTDGTAADGTMPLFPRSFGLRY